jgi:hypothetical protein
MNTMGMMAIGVATTAANMMLDRSTTYVGAVSGHDLPPLLREQPRPTPIDRSCAKARKSVPELPTLKSKPRRARRLKLRTTVRQRTRGDISHDRGRYIRAGER